MALPVQPAEDGFPFGYARARPSVARRAETERTRGRKVNVRHRNSTNKINGNLAEMNLNIKAIINPVRAHIKRGSAWAVCIVAKISVN